MENGFKKEDSVALKGVAILLMLFHHCFRTSEKFAGYGIIFEPFEEFQIVALGRYAKICVSIFAFISGYGLMAGFANRRTDTNEGNVVSKWVGRHLITTLSGYWFLVPLAYVIYIARRGFHFSNWGDNKIQRGFAFLSDWLGISDILETRSLNGSWWYMGAAIVFIVLLPVIAYGLDKLGSLTCILIIFFLPRILGIGFLGGTAAYSFLMIFLIGMLCQKNNFFLKYEKWKLSNHNKINQGLKFMIVLLFVLVGVVTYKKIKTSVFWEYQFTIVPFSVILFCITYIFKISAVKKVLQYIGKHSYNIWLVHTFVRDWGWENINIWSVKLFWLVPLVMLAVSLIISICVNALKKVCGYDRAIQKLLAKLK